MPFDFENPQEKMKTTAKEHYKVLLQLKKQANTGCLLIAINYNTSPPGPASNVISSEQNLLGNGPFFIN